MAYGGGDVGPCFNLPDEILSVMPTDPYEQLDLARKITSMAIASRVTNLEAEAVGLRQKLREKDRLIQELEDKASRLEGACQDAELRFRIAIEDNMKLLKEKESLDLNVKKLNRDLAKLETFKRQLMQSLNDENSPQTETVDIGTYDQSTPKKYSEPAPKLVQRFPFTPYQKTRVTQTGTPKLITSVELPHNRAYSSAGSPQGMSAPASPRTQYEGSGSFSSCFPSSQLSSATNSPPRGRQLSARSPRINGKEFFRQVRSRLSLDQFTAFLTNIKELNAQKQSREETLRKAEEIFGVDNKDLYISFQGLLNRSNQ
ncbi:hypothetical protein MIMGU_mgv1a021123mg [Erythranthe guttata]|uniref:At4g15545-like C-terminal domain-containing protein n=1 Tax=Erythranthe guttata TaxID=4155 RepID=A0A022R4M1_ERYGU|nr:hypothetical protein MIMGU_mgv1a021123mg [Erythranthe guttata]